MEKSNFNIPQKVNLDCDTFNITKIVAFGISESIDKNSENYNTCENYKTKNQIEIDTNCDASPAISNYFAANCNGKTKCAIDISNDLITPYMTNCRNYTNYNRFYLSYDCYSIIFLIRSICFNRSP